MASDTAAASPVAAPADTARRWRFAEFELNELTRELRRNGQPLLIESRPFDLLVELLRHPDQVVAKEDLIDSVWQGRVVSDGVLTQAVMKLRMVLGDDAQAIVRTVHRHGYRFGIEALSEIAEAGAPRPDFVPEAGEPVPHRPNFRFERELGVGGIAVVWLGRHRSTGEARVFKLCTQTLHVRALKREITVWRVLHGALGRRADIARLIDWHLDEPPCFLEYEYISGGSLPQWAESAGGIGTVSLATRIALAAQVADTLADAHAVGVLHKDVKPANVLVDPEPAPRAVLTDFGSGLVLEPERLEQLRITRMDLTRSREHASSDSGTVLYLAPEVLSGHAPTTRSDLYALGVLLFQLVVGDLRRVLAPGWERDVEDELLREDIAAATDGEPAHRMGDARELARRLRTLDARRVERTTQRESERQRTELARAAERSRVRRPWRYALVGALALGLAGTGTMAWRAQLAASDARRDAAVTAAVNAFLNDDLLGSADPRTTGDPELRVRDAVDRAASAAATRFAGQPEVEARVRLSLTGAYGALDQYGPAREQVELASALAASLRDPDLAVDVQRARIDVARGESRYDVAETELTALRAQLVARAGANSDEVAGADLLGATIAIEARRPADAVAVLEALLPRYEDRHGAGAAETLDLRIQLARAWFQTSRLAEAESMQRETVEAAVRVLGTDAFATNVARQDLAMTLRGDGRLDEALAVHQQVLEARRRQLGPEQQQTLTAMNEVASTLQDLGRRAEAEALFREILAVRERRYGDAHQRTRDTLNNLGLVLVQQERHAEAEPYYRRALAAERELLGPDDLGVLILEHNLAGVLRATGRLDEALALHREVVGRAERTLGPARQETGLFRTGLARTLAMARQYADAEREFDAARAGLVAALGPEHPRIAKLDEMRAALYATWGRPMPSPDP
jgi:non-specific serine/threonine protein kinase